MKKGRKNNLKAFALSVFILICNSHAFSQQPRPVPAPYLPGTLVNFIRTWDATAPIQDPNTLMTRPLKDVKEATQYIDGLGRPLQTVIKEGSLETGLPARDLVSPVEYDNFGREQFKYLSFAANTTGGYPTNDGKFKLNPFQQQEVFMNSLYSTQTETYFYSKTNFEASPLGRVNDSYAPGNSWVGSESNAEPQRRNIQLKYFVNTPTDAVRMWNVTNSSTLGQFGTYGTTSNYPLGELYKNITIDEHKKQVIEFKDKEGKVILKKVQLTALPDDGTGSGYPGWLSTYYIYDEFNNLRCVIQPEGVKAILPTWTLTTDQLAEQCFRYEYDQRNRMIMKKVPGAGEVYMIYDNLDRLVMTQDANMRQGTVKWMVTKFDELNRSYETGLWANTTDFNTHLTAAAQSTNYPATTSNYELLTLTHYDNYIGLPGGLSAIYLSTWNSNFTATDNTNWPYPQMPAQSNAVKGMPTWSQIKVLGTANTYLYSVTIYDDKGRPIQVQSTNITGGIDVMTTQYNWAGQPLVNVQKHDKQGANAQNHIVITKMHYDDLGRVLYVRKAVNSTVNSLPVTKGEQYIVQNKYDQLGQIKDKAIGNNNLETLKFDYNIRGWLLGINRLYAKDAANNYFGFDLGYDKGNNGIIGNHSYVNPQYNGNIEGMVWKSKGDGEKRKYDFGYDAANRLMKADFTQYTGGTFNQDAFVNYNIRMGDASGTNVASAYDDNGNILRMQQWGWKLTESEQIDNLRYTYIEGSNKLKSVTDFNNVTTTKLGDFKTKTTHPQNTIKSALSINSTQAEFNAIIDYNYDINGNLILDNNKTITSITYNHLNLPAVILVNNGDLDRNGNPVLDIITYTYDASGNKLEKIVDDALGDVVMRKATTYISGMVYTDDTLQFIPQEEGRIRFKPATVSIVASFQYDYMLKDHLGNVRMVLTEEIKSDPYPAATLENITYQGGSAVSVEALYYNIDNTKIVDQSVATGIPTYQNNNNIANPNTYSNTGANSARLYRLDATNNTVQDKNGLGIVLKVMAGDVVNLWGKSYHKMPGGGYTSPTNPLSVLDLMNLLAASPTASPKGITGTQIAGLPGFPTNVTNLLNNQPPQSSNMPRASINWVILDEQFKYVTGGFDMVGTASNTNGTFKDHTITGIAIPKNGYIYVYCSNESQYNVFFDNLQVVHERGPVLEETHYYPFGLTMAGISSKAVGSLENKRKWNASSELASKEFSDGSGLELYETNYRSLDPQIGRFWQVDPMADEQEQYSPFAFAYNNPIFLNDPLGLKGDTTWKKLQGVEVVAHKNKSNSTSATSTGIGGSTMALGGLTLPLGGGLGTGVATSTGVGALLAAATWARIGVSDLARKFQEKRWYVTYYKVGPGGKIYVGRCSGFGTTAEEVLRKYDASHRMNAFGFGPAKLDVSLNGSVFAKIEQSTGAPSMLRPDAGTDVVISEISGYAATRGREQQLYASFKNAGYLMGNSMNPVWEYNPLAPAYYTASSLAFGPLVPYNQQW